MNISECHTEVKQVSLPFDFGTLMEPSRVLLEAFCFHLPIIRYIP